MTVLHEEYVGRGKESVFNTLKGYVGIGENTSEASYEEAAKALGVKGDEGKLRTASHKVDDHSLALTLLSSYLSDALPAWTET
jgi:hypothetical protein